MPLTWIAEPSGLAGSWICAPDVEVKRVEVRGDRWRAPSVTKRALSFDDRGEGSLGCALPAANQPRACRIQIATYET
jgi:hypothetical protein